MSVSLSFFRTVRQLKTRQSAPVSRRNVLVGPFAIVLLAIRIDIVLEEVPATFSMRQSQTFGLVIRNSRDISLKPSLGKRCPPTLIGFIYMCVSGLYVIPTCIPYWLMSNAKVTI